MTANQMSAIAADLRRIANAIEGLAGEDLPRLHAAFQIQPDPKAEDAAKIRAIDAMGLAVLGKAGALQRMSNSTHHHDVDGRCGSVGFTAFARVASPAEREREEELERLRAALAETRARLAVVDQNTDRPQSTIEQAEAASGVNDHA